MLATQVVKRTGEVVDFDPARIRVAMTNAVAAVGTEIPEDQMDEILSDIVDRELAPGAKLAPQAEMLEEFQVGRASLREALRILETHGLITIKPGPGGGPVVSGVHGADFGRMATVGDFSKCLFQPRNWGAMAESETYAHLEHLRMLGQAERTTDEEGCFLYLSG